MTKVNSAGEREKTIIRTSIIGILANVFLAAFKAAVGVLSHSIAVVMDAVNNLSDAASSVITIVGTRLAAKEPDREHPFGYGRTEYMSALVISLIIMYAGVTSFIESVKKIITPETPDYSVVSIIIIAVGVVVKIALGKYVKTVGERVNSDSLVNSGEDASMDAIISASTLVAAFIFIFTKVSLEAWLGAVISVFIIKSGFEMIGETLSDILGRRADAELAREIKETVVSFPEVSGAYDLVLNNYGPGRFNGSVHIEVPDTKSAIELDELIRRITLAVMEKHGVILTAIGVYSLNTQDKEAAEMCEKIRAELTSDPNILQMHGFYVNRDNKTMRFDIIISFDAQNRRETFNNAVAKIQAMYPDYEIQAAMDTDFSEE
ncbi:MAG: cation transporter [Firmicutes bacterium]|nr:cation transporter [Bacillota bacterium]